MNQLTQKQQDMISNFKWDTESDSDVNHPYFSFVEELSECVAEIIKYVLSNISSEYLTTDSSIEIPVPLSVHKLIADRYNKEFSEDSRYALFDIIRAVFRSKFEEIAFKLSDKINQAFPEKIAEVEQKCKEYIETEGLVVSDYGSRSLRKATVTAIDMHDEPMMDVVVKEKLGLEIISSHETRSQNGISVEISFQTNRIS